MYYSQYGEDLILDQFFKAKNITNGFFVDVGALDGIHLSNTYKFEQDGWNGICIEPHKQYFGLICKNRKSINYNVACGNKNQDNIEFFFNYLGSLSSFRQETVNKLSALYKKRGSADMINYTKGTINMRTLNFILEENNIEHIDYISIDVEGEERFVLEGFDIKKYSPLVVLVEDNAYINDFFEKNGYYFSKGSSTNKFFCKSKEDADLLKTFGKGRYKNQTNHPLGKG